MSDTRTLTIHSVSSTSLHRAAVHFTIYGSDAEGALYFYVLTNSKPPKVGEVVEVTGAKLSPTQPANYIKIPHDTERANRIMDALEMVGFTAAHQFCGIGDGASIEIRSNAPLSIFRALIDETE